MTKTLMLIMIFLSLVLVSCSSLAKVDAVNNMKITDIYGYNSKNNTVKYTVSIKSECNDQLGFNFVDTLGKYDVGDLISFTKNINNSIVYDTVITPRAIAPVNTSDAVLTPAVSNVINITNN